MKVVPKHSWDLTPTEAVQLQRELAGQVDDKTPIGAWETIGALDVSYDKGSDELYAAAVLVGRQTLELVERAGIVMRVSFPYVPGLLSFREAPPLLEAFARLRHRPDVVLVDGHGYSHPRRFGVACHLGLWLDLPTIGVGKTRLVGTYEEPGPKRGDRTPLMHKGEVIGTVLRTRDRVQPVFVSVGHRCTLAGAEEVVLTATPKYRLPAPTRLAHNYVNAMRAAANAGRPIPP